VSKFWYTDEAALILTQSRGKIAQMPTIS